MKAIAFLISCSGEKPLESIQHLVRTGWGGYVERRGPLIHSLLAFNRRYVTRDGCFQDGLGIIRDDAVEVVSVDRLVREWLEYSADVFDGVRRQRNEIRIAAHKRKPLAIGRHGEDVADANDAEPTGQMQHGAALSDRRTVPE